MSAGGDAKSALHPSSCKGEGTLGRKFSLSANHFTVLIKNSSVFHYNVDCGLEPSATFSSLQVTYKRGAYKATVGYNGIKGPANKEKVECEGKMVTVQQYFEHIKLLRPDLPCVWVGGRRDKRNLIPIELFSIPPGQEYRRILKDTQTTNMIKESATPAQIRKKIFDVDKVSCNQQFGIVVVNKTVQFEERVLPAPKWVYGQGEVSTMVLRNGTRNLRDLKFVDAKQKGVINLTNEVHPVVGYCSRIRGKATGGQGATGACPLPACS